MRQAPLPVSIFVVRRALAASPRAGAEDAGARKTSGKSPAATATASTKSNKSATHPKRVRRATRAKSGAGASEHQIVETAPKIVAFPNDGGAVTRAFAEN